jgi:hypothetical protein
MCSVSSNTSSREKEAKLIAVFVPVYCKFCFLNISAALYFMPNLCCIFLLCKDKCPYVNVSVNLTANLKTNPWFQSWEKRK